MSNSIVVEEPELKNEAPPAPEAPAKQEVPTKAEAPEKPPGKYDGKSLEEVIEMHKNAEAELGRARYEVGHVRKLADDLMGIRKQELEKANSKPEDEPLTVDSLLEDPNESIARIARREAQARAEKLEASLQRLETDMTVQAFEKKHPGFQTTMTTPEFGQYVQSSPYRQRLASRAAEGDVDAADELFLGWEEKAATASPAPSAPSPKPGLEEARRATLTKSGGSSANGAAPSSSGGKVYSRSELLEMRIRNPDRFDEMQAEILAAYREGRVR